MKKKYIIRIYESLNTMQYFRKKKNFIFRTEIKVCFLLLLFKFSYGFGNMYLIFIGEKKRFFKKLIFLYYKIGINRFCLICMWKTYVEKYIHKCLIDRKILIGYRYLKNIYLFI